MKPLLTLLEDYLQLLEQLERAFPGYLDTYWEIHSPTCATTLVVKADGIGVQCRWNYGASKTWTMAGIGPL